MHIILHIHPDFIEKKGTIEGATVAVKKLAKLLHATITNERKREPEYSKPLLNTTSTQQQPKEHPRMSLKVCTDHQ
ncbi:hypothetical protein ORI89_04020 [Sphingobacterium sp. UT-1RO-CII-1]|uniref:hypothetical protein n=1 Tax=Sphingobacterium sp. UT-1RO-CII-1 TaxID=2995225 RepID=UPI00227A9771|nr:hypothetical protein [Sphingobacterium sp. UT-1RO-CII-1]MCY4778806.1 hypothetical protein [Sphingobacterium sp. UT-1RO-CII-1]